MSSMPNASAAQAYRNVSTAVPPLQAMVMLFDGAISFLRRSVQAAEQRRFEESHDLLLRATAILRGLSYHLDCHRGGALAERLYHTYNALILACLKSYGRRDARQRFERIIAGLTDLRDAWKEVAIAAKAPPRS